jgi:antirestriction protein
MEQESQRRQEREEWDHQRDDGPDGVSDRQPTVDPEQHENAEHDPPQIYVASLTDYNAGLLHGTWLDAAVENGELQDGINVMLAASPTAEHHGQIAEEWAIHDYQGFGSFHLNEHESLRTVASVARGIAEHGQAFSAWAAEGLATPEELARFEEYYLGGWESVESYAESIIDDFGIMAEVDRVVPEGLRYYITFDAAGFARDLVLGGDVSAVERPGGGVWIFRSTD